MVHYVWAPVLCKPNIEQNKAEGMPPGMENVGCSHILYVYIYIYIYPACICEQRLLAKLKFL